MTVSFRKTRKGMSIEEKTHQLEMELRRQQSGGFARIAQKRKRATELFGIKVLKPCNKLRHGSEAAANRHVTEIEAKFGPSVTLRPYWCRICRAWHVGNTTQQRFLASDHDQHSQEIVQEETVPNPELHGNAEGDQERG